MIVYLNEEEAIDNALLGFNTFEFEKVIAFFFLVVPVISFHISSHSLLSCFFVLFSLFNLLKMIVIHSEPQIQSDSREVSVSCITDTVYSR